MREVPDLRQEPPLCRGDLALLALPALAFLRAPAAAMGSGAVSGALAVDVGRPRPCQNHGAIARGKQRPGQQARLRL